MSQAKQTQAMRSVYGVLLGLILVIAFIALVISMLRLSSADDTTADVDIDNATPVISDHTVAITSGGTDITDLTLTEGTTTNVYSNFLVTDNNGCEEIDSPTRYDVEIYRTTNDHTCGTNASYCYRGGWDWYSDLGTTGYNGNSANTCTGSGDTDISAEAIVPFQFYADPTDSGAQFETRHWESYVSTRDDTNTTVTSTNSFEVNTLLSLNATASIDYGELTYDEESTQKTITLTNTGNKILDANVQATDFTCTSGTIPVGNVEWSLDSGFSYGAGTDLTNSDVNTQASLIKPTVLGPTRTDYIYSRISIPGSTGASGDCQSTFTFTAIDDV